jgi:DMSO/TMAO reductase YedYZ heme-binding membrane subunit
MTRHITWLIGIGAAGAILGIAALAAGEPTATAAWVAARQYYGLTAFGLLLGSCLIGPLAAVFPRMPLRGILISGRRAIGVSACILAVPHVACYAGPVLLRHWQELYAPGLLWVCGLVLGLLALVDMAVLAWTSRDAAVRSWGAKRWKRLHRTVYLVVPVVFVHAVLIGSDFGRAGPSGAEADVGSLVAFAVGIGCWFVLVILRERGVRWPARPATGGGGAPNSNP